MQTKQFVILPNMFFKFIIIFFVLIRKLNIFNYDLALKKFTKGKNKARILNKAKMGDTFCVGVLIPFVTLLDFLCMFHFFPIS
jgi:hypothetical protein